jgi:hypothetical protein
MTPRPTFSTPNARIRAAQERAMCQRAARTTIALYAASWRGDMLLLHRFGDKRFYPAFRNVPGDAPHGMARPSSLLVRPNGRALQQRKREWVSEAQVTLDAIRRPAGDDISDPRIDPEILARAVNTGILDAPHLRGSAFAQGKIRTGIDARGVCVALDPATGHTLSEQRRIAALAVKA